MRLLADALASLGSERAIVFHSENGLDELVPGVRGVGRRGPGRLDAALDASIRPTLRQAPVDARGARAAATPPRTRRMLARLLEGEAGPRREAVLLNAAVGARRRGTRAGTCATATSGRARVDRRRRGRAEAFETAPARPGRAPARGRERRPRRAILADEADAPLARRVRGRGRPPAHRPSDGAALRRVAARARRAHRRGVQGAVAVGRRDPGERRRRRSRRFALIYRRGHAAAISVVDRGGSLRRQARLAPARQGDLRTAGAHEGLRRRRAAARLRGLARAPTPSS